MSLAFLNNIGLNSTECEVYELLVRTGEVPVSTLLMQSKIKRPTIYKALDSLEKKGLVLKRDIRKKIHVRPESPIKLKEIADKESARIEQARQSLNAILPALSMNFVHSTEKPTVQIYEGLEGLQKIYEDTIKEGKPISAILQVGTIDPELFTWLKSKYINKRIKARIHARVIAASSSASKDYAEKSTKEFRTVRLIDSKQFPFQHEIDVYGDNVAIINYKKDEPLLGILIKHPQVARTMKAWFDLTWENLKVVSPRGNI